MAGLLDISPELLKQILQNSNVGGQNGLLYGSTGGYVPINNNSYLQFGLAGDKSKHDSGITGANAELGLGSNAIGVDYNKYYNPIPVMTGAEGQNIMPEAIKSQMQYLSNQPPADLLNLYFKRYF